MIRQRLLSKVIGRKLLERLVGAGWLVPIRVGSAIFYDRCSIHRALRRLGRQGYLINGHVYNAHNVGGDLPSIGQAIRLIRERDLEAKVHKRTPEEVFADLSLDL